MFYISVNLFTAFVVRRLQATLPVFVQFRATAPACGGVNSEQQSKAVSAGLIPNANVISDNSNKLPVLSPSKLISSAHFFARSQYLKLTTLPRKISCDQTGDLLAVTANLPQEQMRWQQHNAIKTVRNL